MSAIDKLTRLSDLSSGDLLAAFSSSAGDDVAFTLATLVTFLQGQLTASGSLESQYYSPNATGWSYLIAPSTEGGSVYLMVKPAAGYAAGTVTLPAQATCVHGQEVVVSCTQSVTTLTVSGNGATVNGAPTTLSANGFFRLRYDGVDLAWYRIG